MRLNSLLFALPLALASPLLNSSDVSATLPTTEEKAPLSRWIVTLEKDFLLDNVLDSILALVGVRKSSVIYTYDMPGYQGFVIGVPSLPIEIPPLADLLLPLPSIKSVEKDSIVKISAVATQNNAPYGLARLSTRANATGTVYNYDSTAGAGVLAYVVDTVQYPDAFYMRRDFSRRRF